MEWMKHTFTASKHFKMAALRLYHLPCDASKETLPALANMPARPHLPFVAHLPICPSSKSNRRGSVLAGNGEVVQRRRISCKAYAPKISQKGREAIP